MKKKIGIILLAALLLSVFQPCLAFESDTYTNGEPTGYVVKLKQPQEDSVILLEESGLQEVYGDEGLYHADDYSDIKKLGSMVEYYEPDYKVTLFGLPNDTYASKQWSIKSTGISYAWDKGYNGDNVKIAVIDSGVYSMHEDFEGTKFDRGVNVIDGSHDVTDEMGHGTFVCGVLGAARDNNLGVAGFCTGATLIPIKCFGAGKETSASYIVSAIYEAVDVYDCDVINLSLGMTHDMKTMREAVRHASDKGVIIVSAVGNEGTTQLNYPAAYDCVIGVGSIDKNGAVAPFSQKNNSVFIVAPGVSLVGLGKATNKTYILGDGTSYSTPHVTAAAAILKQYAPSATCKDFAALLQESAVEAGPAGYDTSYGYGVLNIEKFVSLMEEYNLDNIGTVFPDVKGHWAEQSIGFCVNRKLFTGVASGRFAPETTMNRAMFVTVLSRMSGENISGFPNSFSDVPNNAWYTQPCAWGSAAGIVSGVGNGEFNPEGSVTREQMAVFLYRFAELYGLDDGSYDKAVLYSYKDRTEVSPWAKDAMAWAVDGGLITGRSGNTLSPRESAKRCEVATIISRFVNNSAA